MYFTNYIHTYISHFISPRILPLTSSWISLTELWESPLPKQVSNGTNAVNHEQILTTAGALTSLQHVLVLGKEDASCLAQAPFYNIWKACHNLILLWTMNYYSIWLQIPWFMFVPRKPSTFILTVCIWGNVQWRRKLLFFITLFSSFHLQTCKLYCHKNHQEGFKNININFKS
jgi:hypothetical protein